MKKTFWRVGNSIWGLAMVGSWWMDWTAPCRFFSLPNKRLANKTGLTRSRFQDLDPRALRLWHWFTKSSEVWGFQIGRTIEGFGPKLDQPGVAAERVCTSFFSGRRKKAAECLPVSANAPPAPCYWPGHCAGRQVASGDGLICAKPD